MNEKSTIRTVMTNGIPLTQYNSIVGESNVSVELDGKTYDGFYVSYNNYDTAIYGDVTTALVLGQMQAFYILTGNHSEQYKSLIKKGFFECLKYYKENIHLSHHHSDKIPT